MALASSGMFEDEHLSGGVEDGGAVDGEEVDEEVDGEQLEGSGEEDGVFCPSSACTVFVGRRLSCPCTRLRAGDYR